MENHTGPFENHTTPFENHRGTIGNHWRSKGGTLGNPLGNYGGTIVKAFGSRPCNLDNKATSYPKVPIFPLWIPGA